MDVLVTGASGFLGRNLVKRLQSMKVNLILVDNYSVGERREGDKAIEVNVDKEEFMDYMSSKKLDYVFHLASPCSIVQYKTNPLDSIRNNILGFNNVVELCRSKGAKLIYPSSGNIYGNLPPPQSEDMEVKPNNLYGLGKQICEELAKSCYSLGLRIFAGYGQEEEHKKHISSVVTLFLNDMLQNRRPVVWGDGNQTRDFVYIDDIVESFINSIMDVNVPVINIGSGRSYSFNDLIQLLNKLLGKSLTPIYIDKPKDYVERTEADITLMKKELNVTPIGLEEGLRKYIKYKKETLSV